MVSLFHILCGFCEGVFGVTGGRNDMVMGCGEKLRHIMLQRGPGVLLVQ